MAQVQFGGFKVTQLDTRGGVTSRREKFVFFTWTGPRVKYAKRAILNSQRSSVKQQDFKGVHLEYFLDGSFSDGSFSLPLARVWHL